MLHVETWWLCPAFCKCVASVHLPSLRTWHLCRWAPPGLSVSLVCLLWTVLSVGSVYHISQAFIPKSGLAYLGNYWTVGQFFIAVHNTAVTWQGHSRNLCPSTGDKSLCPGSTYEKNNSVWAVFQETSYWICPGRWQVDMGFISLATSWCLSSCVHVALCSSALMITHHILMLQRHFWRTLLAKVSFESYGDFKVLETELNKIMHTCTGSLVAENCGNLNLGLALQQKL